MKLFLLNPQFVQVYRTLHNHSQRNTYLKLIYKIYNHLHSPLSSRHNIFYYNKRISALSIKIFPVDVSGKHILKEKN